MQVSGGMPQFTRRTATVTGDFIRPDSATNYVQVSNGGDFKVRLYDNQAAFDADSGLLDSGNFIELATADNGGFWSGPAEVAVSFVKGARGSGLWYRVNGTGEDSSLLEFAFYLRRG